MAELSQSLRILQVLEATLGGSGRHVLEMIDAQASRGHEIHFVYSIARSDAGFLSGLTRLKSKGFQKVFFHEIPMSRSMKVGDWRVISELRRYVKRQGPFDVVHSHCTKAGFVARAGLPLHKNHVYTPNAFLSLSQGIPEYARNVVGFGERLLSTVTSRLIAVSEEEYAHALDLGIPESKLVLIANGVDFGRLHGRESGLRETHRQELKISPTTVCVGFVGRMTFQKYPQLLPRVVAKIPLETRRRMHLLAIGAGEMLAESKGIAKELNVEEHISWVGEQDGVSWMPAFDIMLMTSRYEGLPLALIDALGYGLPIVTSKVGGISLLVEDGVNGFVVPVGDIDAMAGRLTEVIENAELRSSMSQAAIRRSTNFTLDQMADSTIKSYRR